MALKKTVTTPYGFEVVGAYHRVEGVQLIGKSKICFQVRTSVDGVFPHFEDSSHECAFDINGVNPISQAYAHLKTLPAFADAADC